MTWNRAPESCAAAVESANAGELIYLALLLRLYRRKRERAALQRDLGALNREIDALEADKRTLLAAEMSVDFAPPAATTVP